MSVIAKDDKQLNFYYSGSSSIAKQTLGYLEASQKAIQLINIDDTKLTGTQWVELSKKLGTTVDGLVNKEHPSASDVVKDADFDEHDWIDILDHCPQVLEYPIVVNGNKTKQLQTPTEILEFYGVDSAGLKKNSLGNEPDTSNQTKGETYID